MRSDKSGLICLVLLIATISFLGCKKSNHDTIVPLGNESYMKSIDRIYPKKYRDLWPQIAPGHETPVYDGILPPDITGEYLINGRFGGGNEWIYAGGDEKPYPYDDDYTVQNKYIYINIKDQKNGIARVLYSIYNNPDGVKPRYVTDTAYIFGDGNTGDFTLCFNVVEVPGDTGVEYYYGDFITGTLRQPDGNHPEGGIADIKRWSVIKGRKDVEGVDYYWLVDGQRFYYDADGFAERVNWGWDF